MNSKMYREDEADAMNSDKRAQNALIDLFHLTLNFDWSRSSVGDFSSCWFFVFIYVQAEANRS